MDHDTVDHKLSLLREVSILTQLQGHPNIIKYAGLATANSINFRPKSVIEDCNLVFEYMPMDIEKTFQSDLTWSIGHVQNFICQLLHGVLAIHKQGIVHRDLKPANLLVHQGADKRSRLKISDFGLSKSLYGAYDGLNDVNGVHNKLNISSLVNSPSYTPSPPPLLRTFSKHVVTRWYRPPEVTLIQPQTTALDMWSVGCIFAEALMMLPDSGYTPSTRHPIFRGTSSYGLTPIQPLKSDKSDKSSKSIKSPKSGTPATVSEKEQVTKDEDETEDESDETENKIEMNSMNSMNSINSKHPKNALKMNEVVELLPEFPGVDEGDQLLVIFNYLGTPTESERSWIENDVVKEYVTSICRTRPRMNRLIGKFPYAPPDALDLLSKLLAFDPSQRLSAQQALDHPFLRQSSTQYVLSALVPSIIPSINPAQSIMSMNNIASNFTPCLSSPSALFKLYQNTEWRLDVQRSMRKTLPLDDRPVAKLAHNEIADGWLEHVLHLYKIHQFYPNFYSTHLNSISSISPKGGRKHMIDSNTLESIESSKSPKSLKPCQLSSIANLPLPKRIKVTIVHKTSLPSVSSVENIQPPAQSKLVSQLVCQ